MALNKADEYLEIFTTRFNDPWSENQNVHLDTEKTQCPVLSDQLYVFRNLTFAFQGA